MNKDKVRIDKWLWAVRVFKTRKIASEACGRGNVKVGGRKVKPSRTVTVGDRITVKKQGFEWDYEVTGCIEKRVGAKPAEKFRKDLTPEERIEEFRAVKKFNARTFTRPRGAGRPTKKERRELDKLKRGA
ncbi:MAG: RNA-binding S4 domain-containing protein [Candidatus Omnitrophica bacterium]|nr:RNA-binding S4 domain-containing protein [Candidatus Omnitrophota bacterium]